MMRDIDSLKSVILMFCLREDYLSFVLCLRVPKIPQNLSTTSVF